jgi:hypothetical protein
MADLPIDPAAQKAAASAAWLQQNRPDMVSQQNTAEQAAAQNAAWRNNTAPVLPRMGSPVSGGDNELIRVYDTTGLTDPRNQAGVARDITRAEYIQTYGRTPEASEQAKHDYAFSPIDYGAMANMSLSEIASRYGSGTADRVQDYYQAHPSARAQAITSEYNARKGVVENPYDPNTAAGIAFEVGRTGGVTTGSLAGKAIGQGYQGDIFAVSGRSTVPTRDITSGMLSGSKLVAALPDQTTTINTPWGSYVQTPVENAKALMDYQTGELGVYVKPYGHSQYMLTAGGGRAALQSGMFTFGEAETPYVVKPENVGSYVMPSGKGMSRLGAEAYAGFVQPLDGRTLTTQDAISRYGNWNNLANYVQQIPAGKAEVKGADIPWEVSPSTPALSYMNDKGIIPVSAVSVTGSDRLVGSKMVASTPAYGSETGGLPAPFVSTSQPAGETQGDAFSQFGSWLAGANLYVAEKTGLRDLPTPTTESIKSMGENPLFVATNPAAGALLQIPQTKEYAASFIRGEAVQLQTRPIESAVSYGVGYLGGVAWKGVELGVGAGRVAMAERVVAGGSRSAFGVADTLVSGGMKYAPVIMAGAYGVNVAERTTLGGTDLSPKAAERLGGIVVGEALPMGIGFGRGYEAPSSVYKAAKVSDIGYKSALQEGTTTGRGDYYVKQPIAAKYEVATTPIRRAQLEVPQFVEEAGGSTVKGVAGYAQYKIGTAVRSAEIPIKSAIQEAPGKISGFAQRVAEPIVASRVLARPTIEAGLGRASIEVAQYRYATNQPIAEAVYGKYFDVKTKLPAAAESAYLSGYKSTWELTQAAKTPSITIKAALQERGGFIDAANFVRPSAEIRQINQMNIKTPAKVADVFKAPVKSAKKTKFGVPSEKPVAKPSVPTVEIKSGRGMTSVVEAREMPREPIQRMTQGVQSDIRGIPVFPSGPSPVSKQKYSIEEETQYFRLPPGMVSPGPKQETRQNIMITPVIASAQQQAQMQRQDQIARPVYDVVQRREPVTVERQRGRFATGDILPRSDITTIPRTTRTTVPITTGGYIPKTDITTIPKIAITTVPRTTQDIVPKYDITTIPRTPSPRVPPDTPLPGGFILPSGVGGATPGYRPRRSAFAETFNMGLDVGFFGRRTKAAKSFTTPKSKRRASTKKKGGRK